MEPADNAIVAYCRTRAINFFRGSETDVLDRFVGCAAAADADIILRLTGDCPFLDPQVIGGVVRLMKTSGAAYASNVSPRTYPDGLDVEAFTCKALTCAWSEATRAIDRDCVTPFIERNRDRFPAATLINPIPGMAGERWVLDTADDLHLCKEIALRHPWGCGPPSMLEIMKILDREPRLRKINAGHVMNERFFASLAEEPLYRRSYERSQEAFARAKKTIPLGSQTFSKSHLQFPQPSPLFLSHGQGAEVYDIDGNAYVDLVSALLPTILGYRDPDVDEAIRKQLSSGISFSLATTLEAELAETLTRLIPCAEMVRFGKTGTDVTTAAIRAARADTGRDRVLICGGYHGWADWSVERNLGVPADIRVLTTRIPFGSMDHFMTATTNQWGDYAAVIVEPESNSEYLRFLRQYCDRTGTVLIFDEVITGFRFHLGGAQALYGVTPDLATFGKSMANGMPLSAVVGRKDIMKRFEPPDNIFYSGTFFGETLSIAAALATIKKLEREDILPKLWRAGTHVALNVNGLIGRYGLQDHIRLSGEPPFVRLIFKDDKIAALFRREMIATGTLVIASHNISAALGPNEIKRILKSYDHALDVIREAIDAGDIDERLAGANVVPMVRA
jgi:glutamate-1-semialdehyde 2,1-aminomutase/spore coat polysaccharide biosynthesis protein SpsF